MSGLLVNRDALSTFFNLCSYKSIYFNFSNRVRLLSNMVNVQWCSSNSSMTRLLKSPTPEFDSICIPEMISPFGYRILQRSLLVGPVENKLVINVVVSVGY